jgi:hypothetical protein
VLFVIFLVEAFLFRGRARPFTRREGQPLTGDERLRGIDEQIKDVPLARPKEQAAAVGQQLHLAVSSSVSERRRRK